MEQNRVFQAYQDNKIAIYGLSPLTAALLKQLDGYQVVGLLDGYQDSGTLYSKPILSIEEAAAKDVRLIIVAARPESCKVIAKRIGGFCKEHSIELLDIRGKDLRTSKNPSYCLKGVSGPSKEYFQNLVDNFEVISVDFFDTLMMRRTLLPTDVFEIMDLRLKQRGIEIKDFPKKRLEGEKEQGKQTVPTLLEIYEDIVKRYSIVGIQPEDLVQLEWETDRELAVCRKELCAILEKAYAQGKLIYIVSDTFYTKPQLAALLEQCGFHSYTDIFPSCEYRTVKTQGLFEKMLERIPGKSCLHIGDSIDADVEGARRSGLAVCQLYSGLELFEKTGYLGLWEEIYSLSSRIQAGMLVASLFNSPFQFEEPGQLLHIDDAYDVGYLILGPIITGFVIWLYRQVREQKLKTVWFCARDGYLIKKLYEQLAVSEKSVYFLTSRFAAIRAGLETEEDLRYVEEMRFSGSLQEQLRERFGITVSHKDCEGKSSLMDFKEELLNAAEVHRRNYQTYLQGLEPMEGDLAFFDFVARGTVQMYIQRLTKHHLRGFYFSQLDRDYMHEKNLDIRPFYEKENSGIYQNFYVLEAVVTAPHPPVLGFDAQGSVMYAQETRSPEELACNQWVQDGISDYFQSYRKLNPAWETAEEKNWGEAVLSLLSKIEIRSKAFLSLKDEDPFFNRTTDVAELL